MQLNSSIFTLVVWACLAAVSAGQQDLDFPYQAFARKDDVPVRSGPGSVHYATDRLSSDAVVSVYRHDPGGWCAVRPPQGSFSLVPQSVVDLVAEDVGRVNSDGVQAWVGTRLGTVDEPMWQVKLEEDERVEVLGKVSWDNPDGSSIAWYQLAPPPGEFRWIHISNLRLPPDVKQQVVIEGSDEIVKSPESTNLEGYTAQAAYQSSPARDIPLRRVHQAVNEGWKPARRPLADRRTDEQAVNQDGFSTPAIPDQGSAGGYLPGNPGQFDSRPAERYADARMVSGNWSSSLPAAGGPVAEQLGQLELMLSQEMLKSPGQWRVDELQTRLSSVRNRLNTGADQQFAARLAQKIEQCRRISAQFRNAYGLPDRTANRPVGTGMTPEIQFGASFDAHGYLNKLIRNRGSSSSTYVLQDETGKITHHVAGIPGLNLNRYLKQKVGISGRRGFHQQLNMDHITVERITVLDRTR